LEEGNKRRYEGKRNTEITQQVGTRGNDDGRTYKYLQRGERFVGYFNELNWAYFEAAEEQYKQ